MRVAHVITRLIVGGAQENTIASVLGLRERYQVRVDLISGPTTGPEGSLEHLASAIPGLLTIVPPLVRPIHPWNDALAWQELTRIFRQKQPEIVHTHSGKAGVLGRFAARRARIPVIVHTIHGPSFGAFQGQMPNAIFKAAERAAARFTTHFVSVANAMTRQYLAEGIGSEEQYSRIFSGFDLNPFLKAANRLSLRQKYGLNSEHFVIGKIARLFKLKGHDDLFAAAPAIVARCPAARFLIVGGGEWRERFESLAREMGLLQHFVFTGLVPPEEVPNLIGIMDVLVHLSRREGLARALPQAMAAGKPVVAYDCDGANEVCLENETGFLVPSGQIELLVDRVLKLAHDESSRTRLGRRGQELVREWFPVDRMVADLYALYQRLLPQETKC